MLGRPNHLVEHLPIVTRRAISGLSQQTDHVPCVLPEEAFKTIPRDPVDANRGVVGGLWVGDQICHSRTHPIRVKPEGVKNCRTEPAPVLDTAKRLLCPGLTGRIHQPEQVIGNLRVEYAQKQLPGGKLSGGRLVQHTPQFLLIFDATDPNLGVGPAAVNFQGEQ